MPEQSSVGAMLRNRELAHRIMIQHNTELAILDDNELAALKRFVLDPSRESQRWVVSVYCGVTEPDDTPQDDIGRLVAEQSGSLVGYVVARYGKVENDKNTLTKTEMDTLREWFDRDGEKSAKL